MAATGSLMKQACGLLCIDSLPSFLFKPEVVLHLAAFFKSAFNTVVN